MASKRMPVRFSSARVTGAMSVPSPIQESCTTFPEADAPKGSNLKEESLIDALQASQAANEALEAVIKLQARAIEQMMEENKKLVQQAKDANGKCKEAKEAKEALSKQAKEALSKPATCEASTETVADEAALFSMKMHTLEKQVTTVQTAPDVPQSSPRIQPPVVPPTPRRVSKSQIEASSELSVDKLTKVNASDYSNASPYVAEAFRLGWLAGVKSNAIAKSKSPSSTRSDDSDPSDPGSFVVGSSKSDSGESRGSDSRGSESPPGPAEKLPALPTMMPLPPPPALLAPPPEIPFEQLG
eukprot:gnl/MRDRNA2_/MRDRNA2_89440_c0_seq1.p1 gnl/MRDRNA2_/MRDRNA2_89440_c0~~gnl/MRDRNA2_/MRDRNA2_89440_c0_seq1.p1  ORF type:complete len:300 (-),score=74.51 gnl/MRDRNA2_/MRDRNA2_89440_c0_seq1:26-925(-)